MLFPLACAKEAPVTVAKGEHSCEHCHMGVVDLRFDGQIQTKKGKIHYFDAIECLVAYLSEHEEEVQSAWVSDYFHPHRWIPLRKARFLQSEKLPSPMGGNLSAYGDAEGLQRASEKFGGEELGYDRLFEYVTGDWNRRFQERRSMHGSDGASSPRGE